MIVWFTLFISLSIPQKMVVQSVEADRIEVVVPIEFQELLSKGPTAGRLKLFLKSTGSKNRSAPADGPFFEDPQPIYSVSVQSLKAGQLIVIDAKAIGWPCPLEQLNGEFEVQAVFDNHHTERGHHSPGNLFSKPVTIQFDAAARDTKVIELTQSVPEIELPVIDNVVWIDQVSSMLTKAAGRPIKAARRTFYFRRDTMTSLFRGECGQLFMSFLDSAGASLMSMDISACCAAQVLEQFRKRCG